jgi:hypothetical protein
MIRRSAKPRVENIPDSEKIPARPDGWELKELLAWAWENKRWDILAQFGIIFPEDFEF